MTNILDINTDLEIIYFFCKTYEEKKSHYQIVLGGAESLFPALSRSTIVRYLFFKKLCKEIDNFEIMQYLDYHFEAFQGDKVYFLDTVKEDMSELFDQLVAPFWLPGYDQEEMIEGQIPLFDPYRYADLKPYGKRHIRLRKWINDKRINLSKDNSDAPKLKPLWNDVEAIKILRSLLLKKKLIDEISVDEFINHFTGKDFTNLINWKSSETVFMSLFDKMKIFFDPLCVTRQHKEPLAIELVKHFTFNGEIKTSTKLNGVRHKYKKYGYGMHMTIIGDIVKTMVDNRPTVD